MPRSVAGFVEEVEEGWVRHTGGKALRVGVQPRNMFVYLRGAPVGEEFCPWGGDQGARVARSVVFFCRGGR